VHWKKLMRQVLMTLMVLLLAAGSAVRADSRFAAPHLGLPAGPSDARSRGMGGVSTAIGGESFAFTNPARTINFWRAGFNGGLDQSYTTLDDGANSYDLRSNSFNSVRGVFPSYNKFVVGWGIYQWREFNWSYTDTVAVPALGDDVARKVQSSGGLYVSRISLARSIGDHLALGLGIDWMFGQAERARTMEFLSGEYSANDDSFTDKYSYIRPTLGLFTTIGSTNIGLSYTFSRQGDRKRELVYRQYSTSSGIVVNESFRMKYPNSWRLGVAQRFGDRLVLGSDLEFEGWSNSDVPVDPGVTPADQWRWGVGVEVLPKRAEGVPWYLGFPVRAGYSRTTYGYEINGARVGEQVFSLGAGSYFGRNNGLLEVAMEYINREVDDPAYPKENALRVTLSVSIFEKWTKIPRRSRRGN
jgi:hypothetical protein